MDWVLTKDCLPKQFKKVLVCYKESIFVRMAVSSYYFDIRKRDFAWMGLEEKIPFAWMPLPEPLVVN